MAFLSKKQNRSASPTGKTVAVAVAEDESKSLVFGVNWRYVASRTSGRADATKLARKTNSTHLLFKHQQYGFAQVPASGVGTLYPAAQVVARQNGGDALYLIKVFDGEYWIAVIRGSQPSDIDRVLHFENDGQALEAAHEELKRISDDDIELNVYTNLPDSEIPKALFVTPSDLLKWAVNEDDQFVELPKGQSTFPKPLVVGIGVAAFLLIAFKGWGMYQQHERQRLAALNVIVEEDPESAWKRAIQTWTASRASQDPRGLLAARVSLGATPLLWGGWYLQVASCTAAAPAATPLAPAEGAPPAAVASVRAWSCSATYQRLPVGSPNRDMTARALPGWSIQYKGLEQIIASWAVEQAVSQLKTEDFESTSFHQVETVSRLQKLLPAIAQMNAPVFANAVIAPPKKSDGTAFPMPPGLPQIMEAELTLKAPLRSVDALIEGGIAADWTQISISYAPSTSDSSLSLRGSAMTADVRGVIYAKN